RPPAWMPVRIGLTADLQTIDRRLTERSREQLARGLIEETREALAFGVPPDAPVLTGIGYAEALMHIHGEVAFEELADLMARSNRRYARRQLRWLRRNPASHGSTRRTTRCRVSLSSCKSSAFDRHAAGARTRLSHRCPAPRHVP